MVQSQLSRRRAQQNRLTAKGKFRNKGLLLSCFGAAVAVFSNRQFRYTVNGGFPFSILTGCSNNK
ncbi:hypothetical protein CLOSTMETH_03736 [[Clostridium] methylpentosum DSM 5476]|uniref:Uncharacterized protein n=1 Tax=[Clostridium] methylpentosum DSM 5476 TaxID=537013 RepID=C0EIP1_9FIRM|nr:hypothetical protein CLOSTMETH_03736 [[Clostridium] methylpentosum DSM 5476]